MCIGCKNIFEEEYNEGLTNQVVTEQARSDGLARVVCLKTLCERVSELQKLEKVKEKLELVDNAISTENEEEMKKDKNENTLIRISGPGSILPGYENIPLIDVKTESEEFVKSDQIRPKSCSVSHQFPLPENLLMRGLSPRRKKPPIAGLDSPDIFHLRAPLVSWENFMTPATSKENMILIEK